jgi:hypothetical protein
LIQHESPGKDIEAELAACTEGSVLHDLASLPAEGRRAEQAMDPAAAVSGWSFNKDKM